jgi:KaiC/GvpD/RAD55 family RecA-like ATPase
MASKRLDGLAARESKGEKVILPVWHNVDAAYVRRFSPTLAGLLAVSTSNGIDHIVAEVQRVLEPQEILPDRVPTGLADLDGLLFGGLPRNYAVALTSPPCDERDLLIGQFLETGAKDGQATFYVTANPRNAKSVAEKYQSNYYLFACNTRADAIVKDLPNVFRLRGVENLNEIRIALTKAFYTLDSPPEAPRRMCIDLISDILLQHHVVQTRRLLSDLIPELQARGFTILAVMNPKMHPSQEIQAILDLFEGEISINEKKNLHKTVRIKRMYNQRYLTQELTLTWNWT